MSFSIGRIGTADCFERVCRPKPVRRGRSFSSGDTRILTAILIAVVTALALPVRANASYGWPVKPFRQEHPVRGQLNDPRINGGTFDSSSCRTFHQGVDISVSDGTAVYAVAPGRVEYIYASAIAVRGRKGAGVFGYWHIRPVVKNRARVKLHALLGYVEPGRGHVHFSEKRNRHYINPLRRGGLKPYTDHTPPTIGSISFYDGAYHALDDSALAGIVRITVNAYDTPQLISNWPWAVVTPSWIRWRLFDDNGQKIRSGFWDFRDVLCALNPLEVFAPGTAKNSFINNVSGAGSYNYWIGSEWDTARVPNGAFWLVVTVADVRGNETTKISSFTVTNAVPGAPASPAEGSVL